jgi:hypothetical protein
VLVAVGIMTAGCASSPTNEELNATLDARLNSTMGMSDRELIHKIGVPDSNYTLADGSRVLEYKGSQYLSAIDVMITCEIRFELDENGTVRGWSTPAGANLHVCLAITSGLRWLRVSLHPK